MKVKEEMYAVVSETNIYEIIGVYYFSDNAEKEAKEKTETWGKPFKVKPCTITIHDKAVKG